MIHEKFHISISPPAVGKFLKKRVQAAKGRFPAGQGGCGRGRISFCPGLRLPRKVSTEYSDRAVHIVLDNARYQKCEAVRNLAAELGITFQYIPPYSPNLNLIERLWKFVKGELRSKYYDNFSDFQNRIDAIIDSTSKENLPKVKKLIDGKVQLFGGMKPVAKNTLEVVAKAEKLSA